jgi:prephenate dehydrogenase
MGASVGLAAKRAGVDSVRGYDVDEAAAAVACERGAVDEAGTLDHVLADADLAVVAAPVTNLPLLVEDVLARAPERCSVTDVGSTKDWSLRFPGRFVGGHPVCGREARGPGHASADLFDGATWFLTPVAGTDPERYRLVHGFVASLGAVPVAIDPQAHDRLVALTSHLPHALANLLVNQAGMGRIEGHDPLSSAGGSLRDMTRVAGANPRIWVDIFLDNAPELVDALTEHRRRVEQLERASPRGTAATSRAGSRRRRRTGGGCSQTSIPTRVRCSG